MLRLVGSYVTFNTCHEITALYEMQVGKSGDCTEPISSVKRANSISLGLFTMTNQNDNNSFKHNNTIVHANSATGFDKSSPIVSTTPFVTILGVHEEQASSSQAVSATEVALKWSFYFNDKADGDEKGYLKTLLLLCICEHEPHRAVKKELDKKFGPVLEDYIQNYLSRSWKRMNKPFVKTARDKFRSKMR